MLLRVFISDTLGLTSTNPQRVNPPRINPGQSIAHRDKMPLLPLPNCQRTKAAKPRPESLFLRHQPLDGLKRTQSSLRNRFKPSPTAFAVWCLPRGESRKVDLRGPGLDRQATSFEKRLIICMQRHMPRHHASQSQQSPHFYMGSHSAARSKAPITGRSADRSSPA